MNATGREVNEQNFQSIEDHVEKVDFNFLPPGDEDDDTQQPVKLQVIKKKDDDLIMKALNKLSSTFYYSKY